ncbi:hypothetical protein D3C73_1243660 [compost metagenome]
MQQWKPEPDLVTDPEALIPALPGPAFQQLWYSIVRIVEHYIPAGADHSERSFNHFRYRFEQRTAASGAQGEPHQLPLLLHHALQQTGAARKLRTEQPVHLVREGELERQLNQWKIQCFRFGNQLLRHSVPKTPQLDAKPRRTAPVQGLEQSRSIFQTVLD